MKDWVTGEEVNYTYDALNRLLTADTTGAGWGQAYVFDGFNNLLQQNVTKGTAPSPTFSVDPATNRLTTTTYDANGNDLGMGTYDRSNRLITSNGASYYYDHNNKRIWKKRPDGVEEYYFYLGNQRLGTYTYNSGTGTFSTTSTNTYFDGKMLTAQGSTILTDRLGSNVTGGKRYFPWGQEKPSATTNNTEKFTGYFRDAESGLDYADQRYHNPGTGRFISADPAGDGSNWYAYVGGDPVNHVDYDGLKWCLIARPKDCVEDNVCQNIIPGVEQFAQCDASRAFYHGGIETILVTETAGQTRTETLPIPLPGTDPRTDAGGTSTGLPTTGSGDGSTPNCGPDEQYMFNSLKQTWGCDRPLDDDGQEVVGKTREVLGKMTIPPFKEMVCGHSPTDSALSAMKLGVLRGMVQGGISGTVLGTELGAAGGAFVGAVFGTTTGAISGTLKGLVCEQLGIYAPAIDSPNLPGRRR